MRRIALLRSALRPLISTGENIPVQPEPIRGLNAERSRAMRRIWFSNSEASPHFPGMLEGAVYNAMKCVRTVADKLLLEQ
jgi:monoamine oxidase